MVLVVRLSDEEKLEVLFLALGLFLAALVVAICLASAYCPLQRWLLQRHEKRRRRQLELAAAAAAAAARHTNGHWLGGQCNQQVSTCKSHSNFRGKSHCNHHGYPGPPPAYEAALRASRLQSLANPAPPPELWLQHCQSNEPPVEAQLDLGDYFHPPKEQLQLEHQLYGPNCERGPAGDGQQPAPVMLRLWVSLVEPGQLADRVKAQIEPGEPPDFNPSSRRLTRQLSIPHLFGSLMQLAGSPRSSCHQPIAAVTAAAAGLPQQTAEPDGDLMERSRNDQMSSLTSSSTCSSSAPDLAGRQAEPQQSDTTNVAPGQAEDRRPPASKSHTRRLDNPIAAQLSSLNPITSRVLHMNVASFSYVTDESLISSKRHNQLNASQFRLAPATQQDTTAGKTSSSTASKMCQLVISICDIENLLNSSWLNRRACAKLAQTSSIYVQCEILSSAAAAAGGPRRGLHAASRLLRNPLRALQQQTTALVSGIGSSGAACVGGGHESADSSLPLELDLGQLELELEQQQQQHHHHQHRQSQHTVSFASTLPAITIEQPSSQLFAEPANDHLQVPASCGGGATPTPANSSLTISFDASINSSIDADSSGQTTGTTGTGAGDQADNKAKVADGKTTRPNWRHEPGAEGRPLVVFQSVPKQLAQQQQLAPQSGANSIDLVQFDSVFVSPILSRSLLETGHLRLRVYSQCKYVNETCLAELRLPLRPLLRAESRDNLGDLGAGPAATPGTQGPQPHHQHQANLILNNLLANLVTASTGCPLSQLIEHLNRPPRAPGAHHESSQAESARDNDDDEEETREAKPAAAAAATTGGLLPALRHSFRLPRWGSTSAPEETPIRGSNSLGASLDQLVDANNNNNNNKRGGREDNLRAEDIARWRRSLESQRIIEQNHCRSMLVSHWLNYLVAPAYECQLVEEQRARLLLGLTYLPTSNRLLFNAHKATIDFDSLSSDPKQLAKRLKLQTDTRYLLRIMMLAGGRVARRKQTAPSKRPEWDSQEAITFDLVNVSVEQPSFLVALVMRNASGGHQQQPLAGGSLQSLSSQTTTMVANYQRQHRQLPAPPAPLAGSQSEPETRRGEAGATWGPDLDLLTSGAGCSGRTAAGRRQDLVIGHLVLADEIWAELRAQPRRQIVREFKLV